MFPSHEQADGFSQPHTADEASLDAIRALMPVAETVDSIAGVFKLLGDGTRVRLLEALRHGERCVSDLASLIDLSDSAVSHQLRLLRSGRLVRVRRSGRLACYSLGDPHVVGLLNDTRKHVESR